LLLNSSQTLNHYDKVGVYEKVFVVPSKMRWQVVLAFLVNGLYYGAKVNTHMNKHRHKWKLIMADEGQSRRHCFGCNTTQRLVMAPRMIIRWDIGLRSVGPDGCSVKPRVVEPFPAYGQPAPKITVSNQPVPKVYVLDQTIHHSHACNCCPGVSHQVEGQDGCRNIMVAASAVPVEYAGGEDKWLLPDGVVTGYVMRNQRGYHKHPCGCWSRSSSCEEDSCE
jgi:hypothetical protein